MHGLACSVPVGSGNPESGNESLLELHRDHEVVKQRKVTWLQSHFAKELSVDGDNNRTE